MKNGIYELVRNVKIDEMESKTHDLYEFENMKIDNSAMLLSSYIQRVLEMVLSRITGEEKISDQINICNNIIENLIDEENSEEMKKLLISSSAEILLAVIDELDYKLKKIKSKVRPFTSITENSLFTGAAKEYSMASELKKEILSSDRVDFIVSFIRMSGLNLIFDELEDYTKEHELRVITTCYMGATELKAVNKIASLPNTEVKISYDTNRTRLHAKSYFFERESGFSSAYIGSSNLSNAALTSGLEWNVKATERSSKNILDKFKATFEVYWRDDEFETYIPERDQHRLKEALKMERYNGSTGQDASYYFAIRPYPYQEKILDELESERQVRNNYRNLLVSATGTGKTVISAFDFRRFKKENTNAKFLFIAHREEILKQAIECYRGVLQDANFGQILTGNYTDVDNYNELFVTIQTLNSKKICDLYDSSYYDYIVFDEIHHGAANSYKKALQHFQPKILLGMTATPERMDGQDILQFFNNRISAEIRLIEAINRKLLVPFQYFCVSDSVDLSHITWRRGGYDVNELSTVYTKNEQRVGQIIAALNKYLNDINDIKAVGFCVSKEHARYMANKFNSVGISSLALDSDSPSEDRNSAADKLRNGVINFIFVVDLYNEGVDIKEIDTILFLRPTESLTIFMQQLGRGLRLSEDKEFLTVFDFVSRANKNYRFESKLRTIIGKIGHSIIDDIENEFPNLPKGCYLKLEKKAKEYILDNISSCLPRKNRIINHIKEYPNLSEEELNVINFCKMFNYELKDIYKVNTFDALCLEAGIRQGKLDIDNKLLLAGFKRFLNCSSYDLFSTVNDYLSHEKKFTEKDESRLIMFYYLMYALKSPDKLDIYSPNDIINRVKSNIHLCKEITDLLEYKLEHINYVEKNIGLNLMINSVYSRDQILAGFGLSNMVYKKPSREGVLYDKSLNIDILFVTLNKSERDYAPSVMYDDYAISKSLFHWQSQNATSPTSATGRRYIETSENSDHKIYLCVRENKLAANNVAAPFYFLGEVYIEDYSGSKPMSIVWHLKEEMTANIKIKTSGGLAAI